MAVEERIQRLIGTQIVRIMILEDQLEQATKRLAELEKQGPDLKVVEK